MKPPLNTLQQIQGDAKKEIVNVPLGDSKHTAEKVVLNDLNNLEWTLKIKAGDEVEIPFQYTVTW